MEFIIFTYTPPRQGFITGIDEKITVNVIECENVDQAVSQAPVPKYDDAYCLVVDKANVTKVVSHCENVIVPTV